LWWHEGIKTSLSKKLENQYDKAKLPTRKIDADRPKKPGGRVISRAIIFKKENGMKTSIIAICLIFAAATGHAGWYDGSDLKTFCISNDSFDSGKCVGFLAAATAYVEELYLCEQTTTLLKRSNLGDWGRKGDVLKKLTGESE
jgi:hypothetical protein